MLNGMSEEEFYDMYPTQEDWENSQQMKLGGLSGAPHNGQPTANEFFSYGSHVNDGLNIPMSNPFYLAHGGTYYGGPTRPYDMGGNTASPMNYGAFNVPMQYGGYEQEYGGVIDPGNNQDYPILEQGGKSALMDIIKAHSKKMRKSYEEGGNTVMQGGNSTDKATEIRNTFKNVLKRNIQNHMINEEEKAFSSQMNMGQMDMGGFAGPGMNYDTTNFDQTNEKNASLASMYQQKLNATQDNLNNDFKNFGNATSYLGATLEPYKKMSVKADEGIQVLLNKQTGKPFTADEYSEYQKYFGKDVKKQTSSTNQSTDEAEDNSKYNRYYYGQGTRGMDYFPMNYNPYTKISKKDDALLRQIAANPSSNIKEYKNINLPLGFGRTKIKFGYKDQAPLLGNNQNIKNFNYTPSESNEFDFQKEATIPEYGPRMDKTPTSLQEGGFKSSRLGPQGQTVEMMMNPFNHGNAFAGDEEIVSPETMRSIQPQMPKMQYANPNINLPNIIDNTSDTSKDNNELYYPETMNPIQAGMPQMSYEDQEVNLKDILNDVPNPAKVSYKNTSDDKPKVINKESAVKVKSESKPVKGVQTPIKKAPAPKTLPVKPKVISNAPMPGVNHTPINTAPKKVSTPPAKKLTQNTGDMRKAPQTGVVVDKRNNQAYYIGDKKQSGSFPVLTGKNVEGNYNPYNVTQLANNPELRNTPVGYYKLGLPALTDPESKRKILLEDSGAKGKEGSWLKSAMKEYLGKIRDIDPISAYGMPAPVASNLGFHRAYSDNAFNPKDPVFVERMKKLNSQNPNMRCTSYGCINVADASYDEIARVFPTSDTLMVLDSDNPLDAEILRQFKIRAKQKKYGGGLKKYQNPQDGSQVNNPISFSGGWNFAGASSTPTPQAAGVAQTPITTTGVQAPKVVPEQNKIGSPIGEEKEANITTKNRPGIDPEAGVNWTIAGTNKLSGGLEKLIEDPINMAQVNNLSIADNAKTVTPANAKDRGDYDINSGMFRMDQMNPVQFPGGMGYSAYGGSFQDGGMQDQAQPQQEQIMQGVATMLQQGAQPEQVAQQLVQMGIPQEQAIEIIQTVMQQMEGGQEQPMQPAMRYGGYAMGGYQEEEEEDEDYYEDDLDEDEIEELKRQGYNVEYI